MFKQAVTLLVSLILVLSLTLGCTAPAVTADKTIKGRNGTSLKVAWAREHRRPIVFGTDDKVAKVAVAVDKRENVYMLDRLRKYGAGRGWWLRKYDRDGREVWTVRRPPRAGQKLMGQSVVVDEHGDIVVLAVARLKHQGVFLSKYSPDGRRIWEERRRLEPKPRTGPFVMALGDSGDIYVAGTFVHRRNRRPWLGRFTSQGKFLWEKWPLQAGLSWSDVAHLEFGDGLAKLYIKQWSTDLQRPDYQTERTVYFRPDGQELASALGSAAEYIQVEAGSDRTPAFPLTLNYRFSLNRNIFSEQKWDLTALSPRGYGYRVPLNPDYSGSPADQLNVWFELYGGGGEADLRALVASAPEKPGIQHTLPLQLIAGDNGNAYLAVLERRAKFNVVRLFKLEIQLPEVDGEIKQTARRLVKRGFRPLLPEVQKARRQAERGEFGREGATDPRIFEYLSRIEPEARRLDERNERFLIGLKHLALGQDIWAASYFTDSMGRHSLDFPHLGDEWFNRRAPKPLRPLARLLRDVERSQKKAGGKMVGGVNPPNRARMAASLKAVSRIQTLPVPQ